MVYVPCELSEYAISRNLVMAYDDLLHYQSACS